MIKINNFINTIYINLKKNIKKNYILVENLFLRLEENTEINFKVDKVNLNSTIKLFKQK